MTTLKLISSWISFLISFFDFIYILSISQRTKDIYVTEYEKYIEKLTEPNDVEDVVKRVIINSKSDIWVATEDPSLL